MAKKRIVLIGSAAQQKVRAGVRFLASGAKLTLGPYGRNFGSGVRGGPIQISNDGVSLAKEMVGTARDEFEEIGLRAVVEAATKTNDAVGDGTTASIVLTEAILDTITFDPDIIGATPVVETAETVRMESELVVEKLNALAVPIKDREHMIAVAKVSVENASMAELIGGTQWDIGEFGTMIAEEHNQPYDEVEMVNGVRWDNGFTSSRFITNQEKQSLDLENVHVLLTTKTFNTADKLVELKGLFDDLIKNGSAGLVIMGRAFDETAIAFCVKNLQSVAEGKGGFPIFPVNAPYTDQENIMEDIAAALGGKFIDASARNMETLRAGDTGVATKLVIKRFEGTVIGKKRSTDERIDALVEKRVADIEEKLKGDISPFERRMLNSRKAQLTSGTAIIKIGAETEQERRYKKDKADDAINAVKAAIQEGVVPGGGKALYMIADDMPASSLISEALRAPHRQIMANAGRQFEVPAHIQDPLRVVRTSFQKASSIARSLSTIEILTNWETEKPQFVQAVNNPDELED